jgi:hypothetical protein
VSVNPQPWKQGPEYPERGDLHRATRHTAAVLADPDATIHDVHQAAELEAATLHAYWRSGLIAKAELEIEPEAEIG